MIDATVLFLTFTDQQELGFSWKMSIDLNSSYDLDDNWHGPMCQSFKNVIRYDTYRGANMVGICGSNHEIIEIAETYHPKYIIYPCHFTGIVTEATLLALRKMGCIVVGYFFDDDEYFEKKSRWMVPYIDYFVSSYSDSFLYNVNRRENVKAAFERIGARCIRGMPPPINPAIFYKHDGVEKLFDATYVGALKANRSEFITNIAGHGSNVQHFGGGHWQKIHWSKMVRIYNQSRINMNFSTHHNDLSPDKRRIVARVFEIPLSGGFLLTEYAAGLEKYFEIGKEIICFETAKDAAEKIQYYLKHPDEREEISEQGYLRAQRDYTGETQFIRVFNEIEKDLLKNGRPNLLPPDDGISKTELYKNYADEYFKWVCALRKSPPPLRDEWRPTARMLLNTNPQNKETIRLLKRAERWGYPEPLLIRFFIATGHKLLTLFKVIKTKWV